jgi:hypothetical protein
MTATTSAVSVSLMDVLREREAQARAARDCHLAVVLDTDSMAYWLSLACKQARETAGRLQVHVAASHNRGVNQSTIARFEDGVAWPRNPDQIVAAYADDLDVDPVQLWQEALDLWQRHRAGEALSELGEAAADRVRRNGKTNAPEQNGPARHRAG